MKHLIKALTLVLAIFMQLPTMAHDIEVDGIYYNINGNEATVTYKGTYSDQYSNEYTANVVIPETITHDGVTYTITAIGDQTFDCCYSVSSITIPNSVKSIGNAAFGSCHSLTSITLPNSITSIGEYAFFYCYGLRNLVIPNSVTKIGKAAFRACQGLYGIQLSESITSIEGDLFAECFNLTSIVIPNSVTTIGGGAFAGCTYLTNILIPNSVTDIGGGAFQGCMYLSSIEIPSSVARIGSDAFNFCPSLTSVYITDIAAWCGIDFESPSANPLTTTHRLYLNNEEITDLTIPNSVTAIGNYAFYDFTNLSNVTIPNSVTCIGDYAFYGCIGLTNINIPNSVTSIGDYAFCDCIGLTNIVNGNSIVSIGKYSFKGCSGITNVVIPNSVETIDQCAFWECNSLTDIYSFSTIPPACHDSTFTSYSPILHVPAASFAAYFTAPYWCNFINIVGDAVEPSLTLSSETIEIQLGDQYQLIASIAPTTAPPYDIVWKSTNSSIATINNGMVDAVGPGECDIIAYCLNKEAICHVIVIDNTVIISLDQQEAMLLPNHMLTLTPSASPITIEGFIVTSSDPTVAAARVINNKVQVVGI